MSKTNNNYKLTDTAAHFPEHGPLDEQGREILLSVKNVDIFFGKKQNQVKAVQNASFDIYKGETFSLVGESGSGKTTIGRAVVRANSCTNGEITYKGVRISGKIPHSLDREVIRNIQMVFQDPAASLNERATVDYIISEGLYNFHLYENEADRVAKVEKIVEEVGLLPEHLTRYPHEFSGGQRQRVGLARAMVMEPELVVADEPISALDVSIRAQILNLMNKFKEERGTTYLFIAHDLSIVRYISDRIGVIYKGRIVEVTTAEELFNYPLHPYTRSLISAVPLPDPDLEVNKVLYTYDPSIHDYSDGDEPQLTYIGHDHYVYGSQKEIEEYKAIREKGEPLKVLSVVGLNTPEPTAEELEEMYTPTETFTARPVHDKGGTLCGIPSFLLPILGLIAAFLFRKKNYMRNYHACLKGAIYGFITWAVLIILLLLLMLRATLQRGRIRNYFIYEAFLQKGPVFIQTGPNC
ncbi:MAG: ATP-binding cassette domain-containing protein [Lachnospiraceae bacterium]|nr:ATP-binding cassette domain-containing protein [Lachnospiraceae bacterium]